MTVFMTPDILIASMASLFPIGLGQQQQNSEPSTPVLLDESSTVNYQFVMADGAGKEPLTFHAAKKTLIDFLRTIAIDSLALPVSNSNETGGTNNARPMSIIDACPDLASNAQHCHE